MTFRPGNLIFPIAFSIATCTSALVNGIGSPDDSSSFFLARLASITICSCPSRLPLPVKAPCRPNTTRLPLFLSAAAFSLSRTLSVAGSGALPGRTRRAASVQRESCTSVSSVHRLWRRMLPRTSRVRQRSNPGRRMNHGGEQPGKNTPAMSVIVRTASRCIPAERVERPSCHYRDICPMSRRQRPVRLMNYPRHHPSRVA